VLEPATWIEQDPAVSEITRIHPQTTYTHNKPQTQMLLTWVQMG